MLDRAVVETGRVCDVTHMAVEFMWNFLQADREKRLNPCCQTGIVENT